MDHIFLSYSHKDANTAWKLFARLKKEGFQVWFDAENLLPGQIWDLEIRKAIESASQVILLLSNKAITSRGYLQKEIKKALDVMDELPENKPFLIPLKIDDCILPDSISHIHCGDLFNNSDYEKLIKALHFNIGIRPISSEISINYARFENEFRKNRFLIIPGYGANSIRIGDKEQYLIDNYGPPEKHSEYEGCEYYIYYNQGFDVRIEKGTTTTVFLYNENMENHRVFNGETPEGLSVSSKRIEIEEALGRPNIIGGGNIPIWTSYDSLGILFTYDTRDENDMNASLRHIVVNNIKK